MDDFSCSREIIPHKILRYFYEKYNPISQKLIHANIFDIPVNVWWGVWPNKTHYLPTRFAQCPVRNRDVYNMLKFSELYFRMLSYLTSYITLPWWRFEQFHVDWVPLVNKTCINTIFWKKDDRYKIQKFSRCFVVAKSVISSRVHFEWVLLEIMIESSKLTSS